MSVLSRERAACLIALSALAAAGCSTRSSVDFGYVDDASISSTLRSRMAETKDFDAAGIAVETRSGAVLLSGTARSSIDRATAESLASKVRGVRAVRNEISVSTQPPSS